MNQMSDEDIMKIKVALLEASKEAGMVGPEHDQKLVDSTKVGVAEALKDTGVIDAVTRPEPQVQPKSLAESLSISFKDLPEDTKANVIEMIGLPRPEAPSPAGSDQALKHVQAVTEAQTPIVDVNAQKQAELALKNKQIDKQSSFPISKFRKKGKV